MCSKKAQMIFIDLRRRYDYYQINETCMLPIFDHVSYEQAENVNKCCTGYYVVYCLFQKYELLMDKLTYGYINSIHFIRVSEEKVFKSCKKSY